MDTSDPPQSSTKRCGGGEEAAGGVVGVEAESGGARPGRGCCDALWSLPSTAGGARARENGSTDGRWDGNTQGGGQVGSRN